MGIYTLLLVDYRLGGTDRTLTQVLRYCVTESIVGYKGVALEFWKYLGTRAFKWLPPHD